MGNVRSVGRFKALTSGRRDVRVMINDDVLAQVAKGADAEEYFKGKTVRASGTLRDSSEGGKGLLVTNPEDVTVVDR